MDKSIVQKQRKLFVKIKVVGFVENYLMHLFKKIQIDRMKNNSDI
jgi:hypothetical protein